jgi:hypothetical protein
VPPGSASGQRDKSPNSLNGGISPSQTAGDIKCIFGVPASKTEFSWGGLPYHLLEIGVSSAFDEGNTGYLSI